LDSKAAAKRKRLIRASCKMLRTQALDPPTLWIPKPLQSAIRAPCKMLRTQAFDPPTLWIPKRPLQSASA